MKKIAILLISLLILLTIASAGLAYSGSYSVSKKYPSYYYGTSPAGSYKYSSAPTYLGRYYGSGSYGQVYTRSTTKYPTYRVYSPHYTNTATFNGYSSNSYGRTSSSSGSFRGVFHLI